MNVIICLLFIKTFTTNYSYLLSRFPFNIRALFLAQFRCLKKSICLLDEISEDLSHFSLDLINQSYDSMSCMYQSSSAAFSIFPFLSINVCFPNRCHFSHYPLVKIFKKRYTNEDALEMTNNILYLCLVLILI